MATKKSMKRAAFRFVSLLLLFPIYLISKMVPKDKQLYIFGSSLGYHFADNSKYLFLYTSEHVKNIESVYISKNQEIVSLINNNGMSAQYLYSYSGFRTVLRAKKAFISHSVEDIHPILMGGAEVIQLWHGTPLKRIGYDADFEYGSLKSRMYSSLKKCLFGLFPYLYCNTECDKLVISSNSLRTNFKSAFNKAEEDIFVLGQPRNDCMEESYTLNEHIFPEIEYLEHLKNRYTYLIAWLPTHRLHSSVSIETLLDDYSFNIQEFSGFLRKQNSALVIKPHFIEQASVKEKFNKVDNIIVYDYGDPYPLMRFTDILITDYSSIYFDFLLLDRPILFAPFDYEDFILNNANLYYDYERVTPGPKCNDWLDIMKHLTKTMNAIENREVDSLQSERELVSRKFNDYRFGNSKRIVENFVH